MVHELYEQREAYLTHALKLSEEEFQAIADFESWLPSNIIDVHAHSNLTEHVEYIPSAAYNHMLSTFPSYSLEESRKIQKILHLSKKIRALRFAKTFKGINHKKANTYLLEQSPVDDRVALFGLPEDIGYIIDMLAHARVSALKMYYSYLSPPATKIYDIFKPSILKAAEEQGVPIVLHVPLIITKSLSEIIKLSNNFPNLKCQ